jgi:hypothetical protein
MVEQKKVRNVKKSEFVLQEYVEDTGEAADSSGAAGNWHDWVLNPAILDRPIGCAADLRRYVARAGLAGTFRAIAVKDQFATKSSTVTKITFE